MSQQKGAETKSDSVVDGALQKFSAEEVKAYLSDLEEKVINSDGANLHSIVALNDLLQAPNAEEVLTEDLKSQMKDLWIKLKSTGIHLVDPPLLFGLPESFHEAAAQAAEPETVDEISEELEKDEEKARVRARAKKKKDEEVAEEEDEASLEDNPELQ